MKYFMLSIFMFSTCLAHSQNQVPRIANLAIGDDSQRLTIQYDLLDHENDDCTVRLLVSTDGGISYNVNTSNATGDVNEITQPAVGKIIKWEYENIIKEPGILYIKLVVDDGNDVDIQALVDRVDMNSIIEDLNLIVGIRHRTTGVKHLEEVRELIKNRFLKDIGNLHIQEFDYRSYTGQNIIATMDCSSDNDEIFIVDAHYDGVANTPGADDNGSGTAGLLEAAKVLSQYPFRKQVDFIGFDLEESGLIGSRAYAQRSINDHITGVINFESIGYYDDAPNSQGFPAGFNLLFPQVYAAVQKDSFRGNFIANVGVVNQDDWELKYEQAAKKYVPELKVINIVAPDNWQTFTPDLARSDHAAFWLAKKPAIMLSGTANFRNANYHTPNDTIGSINYEFLTQVVKAAVATIAEQAEIIHGSTTESTIEIVLDAVNDLDKCTFELYPNPVLDKLYLNNLECSNSDQLIEIFDINGQRLYEYKILLNTTAPNYIDVQNWNKGLYILKLGGRHQRFVKL